MQKIIAYFLLFISFCLIFRTAVLNNSADVHFSDYINTIENIDNGYNSIQADMRAWADSYKQRNNENLDYSGMPEWYVNIMRWFIDLAYSVQMMISYAFGLTRYLTMGVTLIFSLLFL